MFKALGWDMENISGYAEAYKDVIHEDAIKIGGATKAPDYCFRIGGTRKFFLEAKKPSIAIKNDPLRAYQLRRYAWSAKQLFVFSKTTCLYLKTDGSHHRQNTGLAAARAKATRQDFRRE